MIYRQMLICFCLFASIMLSTDAFPPPSPAGGNYLVLDGVNDYAVLSFETFGILLPEGTDEFTVEAWVYPTAEPHKNITATILSQQVRMTVASGDNEGYQRIKKSIDWQKGDLFLVVNAHVAGWGGGCCNAVHANDAYAESMASYRLSGETERDNNHCQRSRKNTTARNNYRT